MKFVSFSMVQIYIPVSETPEAIRNRLHTKYILFIHKSYNKKFFLFIFTISILKKYKKHTNNRCLFTGVCVKIL